MGAVSDPQASYVTIIDSILKGADLNTISAKRIRKGLQAQLEYDISDQKQPSPLPKKRSKPHDCDEQDPTPSTEQLPPPKKKIKRISQSQEEDDAAYAARLQAELNRAKAAPLEEEMIARSRNRDDDSDVASGDKKSVKRTGGFHKPLNLSQPLSELLGETQLSSPQVVKQIWAYVRERELQDPSDKRQIRCDGRMHAVFKTKRVQMCTMNKILSRHVYAADE
ncbi:SWIB-domain-containing protein [Pseudovirgaria hyperparasitica]|uniref:SWIB-domain-containing protein n=1 Tax=Pseudovirgaria hyperparasitica TaxID=470096 RepID=A0A6A6VRU6_9PEZI|nr:SWIB-domain-containing protein [Pseudovirgaria hyperparasitica]KAF2752923.1 SWIB-domain-containing protein [Pseudovirgaria hyperparasitica]